MQAPQVAASKAEIVKKIKTLAVTKRRQLGYLMQSADWTALPMHERAIAEALYDDIDNFVVDTKTSADRISYKLAKLERRMQEMLTSGEVTPRNGGLQQLLSHSNADADADADEQEGD